MQSLNDQERARRDKLATLQSTGIEPYPARLSVIRTRVADIRQNFAGLESKGSDLGLAGRVRAVRLHGGSMFIDLDDGTATIQCYLMRDLLGDDFDRLNATLDLGDFLEVQGAAFTTKRGEQSVKASLAKIIGKALRPLPEKWHGLADVEVRYRHRELDLIANDEVKRTIMARGKIINALRNFLVNENFLEVETPILQSIPGGATARPFATHHNALDADFFLRVAPELFLKRLIIGGLERVFEIARCFRNEGIDHLHNPEFTQIELYAAYTDYEWMMELTERMLREVTTAVHGKANFLYDGTAIILPERFPRVTFRQIIIDHGGPDIETLGNDRELATTAKSLGVEVTARDHRASLIDGIFKTIVRPKIIQPVFVIDHPIELSPLAKKKAADPRYTERFQLLIAGSELCNAFSELNDPIDQRERFAAQEKLRAAGDDEAQRVDEDFLEAMEYGMPPTSGLGIGIDRLSMLLTDNHSIKEVIAFPTLKPKS